VIAAYISHLEERGRSPRYLTVTQRALERLAADPQAALDELAERATESSVDDAMRRLRSYGRWLEGEGEPNPYADLRRPRAARQAVDRAVFTAAEVRRLTRCADIPPERRVLWGLMAWTGLRPKEAAAVTPGMVVRVGDRWELRLPADEQKARRADIIELDEEEARGIRRHAPLVRCAVGHLDRYFKADLKAAGISRTQGGATRRPYDLRSFFVSELFRQGADPRTVQHLARHRQLETTLAHYTRFRSGEAGSLRQQIKRKAMA